MLLVNVGENTQPQFWRLAILRYTVHPKKQMCTGATPAEADHARAMQTGHAGRVYTAPTHRQT